MKIKGVSSCEKDFIIAGHESIHILYFTCELISAYPVTQGIGSPCTNIPGPKGVVSPVSGSVG